MKPKIMIVDDEPDICRVLEFLLKKEDYDVVSVNSGEDALKKIEAERFDVVITDLTMGEVDGMAVLDRVKQSSPETATIMMTAFSSVESAVEAMKKGAADYIVKPFINEAVKLAVRKTIEHKLVVSENIALRQERSQRMGCRDFIAVSDPMLKIMDTLEKVIPTKSNILILGESGTGKGLFAELIHCNSPRKENPFISINCSAIPEGLLESELFGYKKGAFTGAVCDKLGLIPLANNGTLFLDEIGDMPTPLQAKLLKVIETGDVYPLGDTKHRTVDVRIISATNVDIESRIKEGRFREDLYWRLNVIDIKIPPLRERRDDIEILARHFMKKFSNEHKKNIKGFDKDALSLLINYPWPGNIRELKNIIERSVVLAETDRITLNDLPDKLKTAESTTETSTLKACINDYEKNLLLKLYSAHNRNKEETAKMLGIDLATLYRKFKKYGIDTE